MTKSLVYFGSPDFSASVLNHIYCFGKSHDLRIKLVVTQPDRLAGRGLKRSETHVKKLANELGLDVFEYSKDKKRVLIEKIKMIKPAYGLLYAFNEIITGDILELFSMGLWNIHPSLLPEFRGPSPIAYPLILGRDKTGVTIIKMDKTLDTGDILAQKPYHINPDDNACSLIKKLSYEGFLLVQHLFSSNSFLPQKQDHSKASLTKKLTKDAGYLALKNLVAWQRGESLPRQEIPLINEFCIKYPQYTLGEYLGSDYLFFLWRGLHPWPGIWTKINIRGKELRLKVLKVSLHIDPQGMRHAQIELVQLEGKNSVSFSQWNREYGVFS